MDARVATVTVRVVAPESPPSEAIMEAVPIDAPVARPEAVTVAAAVEELQVAEAVISCLVVSEKMPMALNCWFVPFAMLGLLGKTSTAVKVAAVTVSRVLPVFPPKAAVRVVVPAEREEASPLTSAVSPMVATAGFIEVHDAAAVRS